MSDWRQAYAGKTVLVTGCCGTVGAELVRQLLDMDVASIRGIDNVEEQLFYQQNDYRTEKRFDSRYVDIRALPQLAQSFVGVDIVLHAAALKQVPICEEAPDAAVDTNIIGVQNVIEAARQANCERVLFTSSDKAVNPTNVMGTSKLMGERLISAANVAFQTSKTIFASTRFGNVAGSKGSVMPLFANQIREGNDITLTSERMTRFMMTNAEACELVLKSAVLAKGGEVFVTKMPVVGIKHLAETLRDRLCPVYGRKPEDIKIIEIGARPGEKDYEELTTHEEIRRTFVADDMLIVLPAYSIVYTDIEYDYDFDTVPSTQEYNSDKSELMNTAELNELLDKVGVER